MKTILIVLIAIHCSFKIAYSQSSQQWVQTYNGTAGTSDNGYSIAVDAGGNVYVAGSSTGSSSGLDYVTIKYNSSGIQQWASAYNGPGNSTDVAISIAVDASGYVYVTGYSLSSSSPNSTDYATVKYNSSGAQQWVQRYNGTGNDFDYAVSIAVDASGNVYVTGRSTGSGASGYDIVTIKYNSSGAVQWTYTYIGPVNGEDVSVGLVLDNSANVYITGYSAQNLNDNNREGENNYDYITIKCNPNGSQQWVKTYNGAGNSDDHATSLKVDGSGNVYVTGYSDTSVTRGFNNNDYATIKYNSSGIQQWIQRYNGAENSSDIATSLALDGSGNVFVTGYSAGTGTDFDYATLKYNSSGVQQWLQRYNGPAGGSDRANHLVLDASGNVYVTGYSIGTGSQYDYATIKYNTAGIQQWLQRYNGAGNSYDYGNSIAIDALGRVCVTGTAAGSGTGEDIATLQYLQSPSAPVLLSPANGSMGQSLTPLLDWQDVTGASSYRLQVSTNSGFTTTIINDSTLNSSQYTVGSGLLQNNVLYYWRVNAKNTAGTSSYSTVWNFRTGMVGINPVSSEIPGEFKLFNNYPNPFNPATKIKFDIPAQSFTKLTVYDITGREVKVLINDNLNAGRYEIDFNAAALSSGVYFYRIEAGDYTDIKKMILVK